MTKRELEDGEMVGILVCVFVFLLSVTSYLSLRRDKRKLQKGAKLPPGSMGWPFIGETLQLYSQDPNVFFASKQQRFQFSLHLLAVMSYLCFLLCMYKNIEIWMVDMV